ncbi:uncharacterized protein BDW47DRAFT_98551 [Aspergillus candidus]|uniref:Uncharacterized protein n=1 Tax=Aspergillus candidus TaxID=41067 RepID=A0A2I2FMA8_ASPCN|nr:hypothetical protein BDW47DRAFT_98551 [Aspergillus candidus]PLB41772.1 hypothetical protein BDW47DRAFT_98551 [Aspergillus candidus]
MFRFSFLFYLFDSCSRPSPLVHHRVYHPYTTRDVGARAGKEAGERSFYTPFWFRSFDSPAWLLCFIQKYLFVLLDIYLLRCVLG